MDIQHNDAQMRESENSGSTGEGTGHGKPAECAPADETERIQAEAPGLVAVLPIEDRGRHELIRLGAALARHLPGAAATPVLSAAHALGIRIPEVESIEEVQPDVGILALLEGRRVAFGREEFVSRVAQHPHLAEREAGRRIEAQSGVAYYVVVLDGKHCVGLLGIATSKEG